MMRRLVVATLMFSMVFLGLPMTGGSQGATADQYYQYGNKLYMAKDYVNAAKYYQAAVQLNPQNAQAFQVLGNCYLLTNRKADAVGAYEKALAINPNNPQLAAYVQNLKNQLGATAPAAAQPAAQPAAAQATTAPAQATASSSTQGMQALQQGGALFQQKQYAAAIPYFQQAAQLLPTDYRASYYLAYTQYMTRDFKDAAVNFYLANQKQPNATLKSYADRIKASLPLADQQWVDAQVASAATTGSKPIAGKKEKAPKFGIRALAGVAIPKLKDFNDDADYQTAAATAYGYGLTGQVPKGNLWIGGEPFYRPIPAFEVAAGFGIFPVGKYSYTASGWTALTSGAPGYGTPTSVTDPTYPGDSGDTVNNEMKVTAGQISLTARYYVGGDKAKGFLGAGVGFYPTTINWTRTIASGLGDPNVNDSYSGSFTKNGIGEHVMLGGSFRLGQHVGLEPYVMYRIAKLSGFTGSIADSKGTGTSGTLTTYSGPNGVKGIAVDDGTVTLPTGWTSKPLEVDLSGIQFGLGIAVYF
jgi:tetratricopeptide (TPR) repeat protein